MPTDSAPLDAPTPYWSDGKLSRLPDDAEFDRAFPDSVRESSALHWTSVEVCRQAAAWLVTGPETRVLDVGCGPGKFCAIGALTTPGQFTGVEQRRLLCRNAREMLGRYGIRRVQIMHANITEVSFNCFDAFYLFNPFEENLSPSLKIDDEVKVRFELYDRYINYVRRELSKLRLGTRVVTYWGDCDEIPSCYDCVDETYDGELRFWIKRRAGTTVEIAREAISITGNECDFPID
ncbi:MAG: class I SAM-dependent methyltransferase [Luteolibacter sp.]